MRFDASRPDFSPYGLTCELWAPGRMPKPNRHNEIELNLLTAGSLTYLLGGCRTVVEANKLAVFWAAIPHQIVDFEGDSPYFVATVPLSEFLHAAHDVRFTNRLLRGELLVERASDETDPLKFQQWERVLRAEESAYEAAARLEIQARLVRFAGRLGNRPGSSRSTADLSRADQIACFIARNYYEPLTADSIAEAVGVHPNYAMNLFRQTFGTTMTAFNH
jgi:hypothetical protein